MQVTLKSIGCVGLFLLVNILYSQSTQVFYAEYTYTMGDNDSKSDAKRIAFLEAKRLCVEQAGVFLSSEMKNTISEINNQVDETFEKNVTSVASAVVKAKIIDEKQIFENGALQITVKVQASVDIESARKLYDASLHDPEISNQLELQQIQLSALEDKLTAIQKRLSISIEEEAVVNRAERRVVLSEISKTQAIQFKITSATERAVDNIIIGMTKEEVMEVAGEPRAVTTRGQHLNYGNVWVVLEYGLVGCIVEKKDYPPAWGCNYLGKKLRVNTGGK
jgi:hypothetical protein